MVGVYLSLKVGCNLFSTGNKGEISYYFSFSHCKTRLKEEPLQSGLPNQTLCFVSTIQPIIIDDHSTKEGVDISATPLF